MRSRWFGPKLGSGRGLSALIGGAIPASWQGWLVVILFLAVVIGLSLVRGLTPVQEWGGKAAAVVAFVLLIVVTYGRDPD